MKSLVSRLPDHYLYPEWRVVVDRRLEGIDPRTQDGFYTRQPDPSAARRRYREVHKGLSPSTRLDVERWKEPTPLPEELAR